MKLASLDFTQVSLLIANFWTTSLNWKLSLQITWSDLLQLSPTENSLPAAAENWLRTDFRLSYKLLIWHAENTALLLLRDVTAETVEVTWPLLTIARSKRLQLSLSNKRGVARWVEPRLGTTELGSARNKHRFVYCCVIAETGFEVTVIAWCKYTTISNTNFHTHKIFNLKKYKNVI
jgi:hypothetical protein